MRKGPKIFFFIISLVFFVLTLSAPLVSSIMQSYYKGFVGSENTEALLEKKAMWAQIGETKIFFILFLISVTVFILAELFVLLSKAKSFKKS